MWLLPQTQEMGEDNPQAASSQSSFHTWPLPTQAHHTRGNLSPKPTLRSTSLAKVTPEDPAPCLGYHRLQEPGAQGQPALLSIPAPALQRWANPLLYRSVEDRMQRRPRRLQLAQLCLGAG